MFVVHVGAGGVAILAGTATVIVRKGERLHRVFGTVFFTAMLIMAVMAVYLALFVPARGPAAPPQASVAIAILTSYLVLTAWMAARHSAHIGMGEKLAFVAAAGIAMVLAIFGVQAAMHPGSGPAAPYFVFAVFAAFCAALDLRMILRTTRSDRERISRHLWRMCFAFFFATSFFFLGQQKVMPESVRGSPLWFVPALAPLAVMIFWFVRVRFTRWLGGAIDPANSP
jgi:uncharacterized membrane protein